MAQVVGIKGHVFNFIERFINNQIFSVNVNSFISNKLKLENDIPHGSVTESILFSIFINDLAKAMTDSDPSEKPKFSLGLFADDVEFFS